MLSPEKAQEIIENELEKLSFPSEPQKLYEPVKYILANGGKRIRPSLVLLACDMFGGDYRKAIFPALGIEVFHNFTLLHDDLMDQSPVRRNRPTVHLKWDQNTAILSGDVMSILASKLISMIDKDLLLQVNHLFNKTALEVCEGQMLDMEYSLKETVSVEEYIKMIGLKTSVLIAASAGIGAIAGGAEEKDSDMVYRFGHNLGLAFQLQDDLLDSFGRQEVFGKSIGNDILTNKKTFLLIKAFENAKGNDLSELKKYFSGEVFNPGEKIEKVISLFNKLGIPEICENRIKEYYNKSIECLTELALTQNRKETLFQFSEKLMKREK